jgi:23S rRNA (cytosine1962-C5)-methyltransferase
MLTIKLKKGRQKSLLRRHPWVFSGAIADTIGTPTPGDTVRIIDSDGEFLAWGAYSPSSQIRARVWSWDEAQTIDEEFFSHRLEEAIRLREDLLPGEQTNALRLVYAESDGLPGLIVDRYNDGVVMQVLSSGIERWLEIISDLLVDITGADWIYERSDVKVRQLEGLNLRKRVIRRRSTGSGSELPWLVNIHENGLKFRVDVQEGQKTGFYLDQRRNRAYVGGLSHGKQVLDCFSYTGGFTINALRGGAESITAVDSSLEALNQLEQNILLNKLPIERVDCIRGDVFQVLRSLRDEGRSFDMVILDPPKFAPTRAQAESAARGYKDINLLAMKLLRPMGLLATFSCSGGINMELFQKIVAGAALDAGRDAKIIQRLHQDLDHPVALNFPESYYLKGIVVRV